MCLHTLTVFLQKRKGSAGSDGEGEQEESAGGSDVAEDSEDEKPKARSKAVSKASRPAASADPKVKKLQAVCRQAGIKITPNIYVKVRHAADGSG
jgi:hypothetical protein